MINLNDLQAYAAATSKEIIIEYPTTYQKVYGLPFNKMNAETSLKIRVGIKEKYCYFWFDKWIFVPALEGEKTLDQVLEEKGLDFNFEQRYSQNTGKAIKGWKTGWNYVQKIKETLNK